MWCSKIQFIWMVIVLVNIKLCNSSGKLSIQLLRFKNNKEINNGDCCDNIFVCIAECDIYFDICVTEVSQAKCSAEKFVTKVLGEGSFTFPGIGGDLGNGKYNPLEYSFQKWQGFTLAIEIWDYDSGFLKGSSDFVDNIHLDISDSPDPNHNFASSKTHRLKSKSSPTKRYLDLELKVYCDDRYLVPDCARKCIPRDDAQGHYMCDYVNGRIVCNQYWYGDRCVKYCKSRNDSQGRYTCDKSGMKICAGSWFGENCSTFCKNTDDASGHYECDAITGRKICLANWYGEGCLAFCKAQDKSDGHFLCNKTTGEKVCLTDWYGAKCTKHCSPQNDRLLGQFKCDVHGDKVCFPGWHGVNCTKEVIPTTMAKISTTVQASYYIKTPHNSRNAPTQSLSTSLQGRRSTTPPKPTINAFTSVIIISSALKDNQLHPTSTIYFETVPLWISNHETASSMSTLFEASKYFPLTQETNSFQITSTTPNHFQRTRISNSFNFKSTSLNSFNIKTTSLKNESKWRSKQKISLYSSTETPKPQKASRTAKSETKTDQDTPRETQSSLAMDTYSYDASREKQSIYESTLLEESAITTPPLQETLAVSNSIFMSKIQQKPSNSIKVSSCSNLTFCSQTLTYTLYVQTSVIDPSILFDKKIVTSSNKTKFGLRTKSRKSSRNFTTAEITQISTAMTKTSSPISATTSVIMTSSRTIEMNVTGREKMTFIVKLNRDKLQEGFQRKLTEQIQEMNKSNKELKFEEVYIRKIEKCKNTVLLAVDLTYNYENGSHKLPDIKHAIKTILGSELNSIEIIPQHGSDRTWECSPSQSTSSASKRDNFVVVFFPIVVFMMALGVGICIKIKHKNRILNNVVPVNHLLNTADKANERSHTFRITHDHSQQELLEMNDLTTTAI